MKNSRYYDAKHLQARQIAPERPLTGKSLVLVDRSCAGGKVFAFGRRMIILIALKRWPRLVTLRRNRSTKLVGAIVATAAYFLTAYWLKVSYVPNIDFEIGPRVVGEKILLLRPFVKVNESDFAVVTERYNLFDSLADSDDNNDRSTIELYENGKRIGPAHSKPSDIAALGQGRFSHWRKNGTTFYWSSGDNSDPNTNGRAYWVVKPDIPDSHQNAN